MVILNGNLVLYCVYYTVHTHTHAHCVPPNPPHSRYHKEQLKTQASDVLTALSFSLPGKVRQVKDAEVPGEKKKVFHYPSNVIPIDSSGAEAELTQFY